MYEDYDFDDRTLALRQRERNEAEYQAGIADGERYSADRRMFGDALADQFAMQAEQNRYDAGDDDY